MVTVNIDGFLSTAEVAERLNVKVESVYTFARRLDGFPQPTKVGRTLLWPTTEVDAWRAEHPARKRGAADS